MGKKGTKRKTRWRVLPIGGDDADCLYSTNEDDGEADHAVTSPTATNGPGSYARAAQPGRGKPGSKTRPSGYQPAYYRPHRSMPESRQPLVTAEKKTFNEEEYTKITTPRQDVLFKKGYLGRKKTVTTNTTSSATTATAAPDAAAATASAAAAAAVTGAAFTATNCIELAPMHNGVAGDCEPPLTEQADVMSPVEEQPQYIYPNGYVDGVIYVNGGPYEWYDPYGNVTVVVGPAPPFAGPGGGASVLAAVPCQPLPLQPIEWFNPAYGVPYVAPALPSCPRERGRRKRCSADSQNCSPQSSESTDPPGSPQEGEGDEGEVDGEGEGDGEGDCEGEIEDGMLPALPAMMNGTDEYAVYPHGHPVQPHPAPQPHAYMYPGAYMFGPPIYSMNGITVQSTSQLPQNTDISGTTRRKKKRRRRRRRGGVDNGSEETSSDEKDLEEPISPTSQESSQEVESDSKNSAGSASCPTIVGCPELPERTPESPSSSPSLSPSLSPSPSPLNATEDKTALPKVNYVDTSSQQEKINVRSEGILEHSETVESKLSLKGVDESNSLLSFIPNVQNADDIHKLNETNFQSPNTIQNGDSNVDPVLVTHASKTNGNHPVDGDKPFELDNNLSATDSFTVSATGEKELVDNVEFKNECATKNNVSSLKQKAKGKKGLKLNKQKNQLPVQNGFSELEINDNSSKFHETPTEMDGNESGRLTKDKSLPSGSQSQSSPKQTDDSKAESGALPGSAPQLEDSRCKSKGELLSHVLSSPQVPKKPARTHHKQHQEKAHVTQSVPRQKEDESLNVSSVLTEGKPIQGETKPSLCTVVPQCDHKRDIDVTISTVSVYETKLHEKEHEEYPKLEKIATTIKLHKSDKNKSTKSPVKEQIKQASTDDEANNFKKLIEKGDGGSFVTTQEIDVLPEEVISDSLQDEPKNLIKSPNTDDSCISEVQEESDSCDTNENNKNNVQKPPLNVPELDSMIPPIPPPRRKKWQPNRKCSVERPPTPGKELEAKKQRDILDDSSSSSSRESEESVIDLLSSSPNDKSKDSKDILQEITYVKHDANDTSETTSTFEQSSTSENIETLDKCSLPFTNSANKKEEVRKQGKSNEHALKSYESTMCISKQSQQNSKGDQSQQKLSEFKSGSLPKEKVSDVKTHSIHVETSDNIATSYADDLACQVLDEGLSSAATSMNKSFQAQSLSLTEAVTQWLHSQDSEEILQVPQLLELESDIEEMEEASEEEIQMTGPKNVYRNPLLAPSCESDYVHDDASIRVANLDKNNTLDAGKETNQHVPKSWPNTIINNNVNEKSELSEELINEMQKPYNEERNLKIVCDISSNFSTMQKDDVRCIQNEDLGLNNDRQNIQGSKSEEWDSFTSESVEYDADWECDPIVLKHSSRFATREDQESHLSLESCEDKCSHMCDPTLSVAKYYRLGPPPEKFLNNKDVANDFDSGKDGGDDYNDEGMDALIHFRNEFEDYSCSSNGRITLPQRYPVCDNSLSYTKSDKTRETNSLKKCGEIYDSTYDGFTSDSGIQSEESCNEDGHRVSNNSSKAISEMNKILKRKSAILLSHLGAEGPFPCGGICCILQ